MDSKKIEIRPCPTYRSTGQDSCRRPDRVIVAEQLVLNCKLLMSVYMLRVMFVELIKVHRAKVKISFTYIHFVALNKSYYFRYIFLGVL